MRKGSGAGFGADVGDGGGGGGGGFGVVVDAGEAFLLSATAQRIAADLGVAFAAEAHPVLVAAAVALVAFVGVFVGDADAACAASDPPATALKTVGGSSTHPGTPPQSAFPSYCFIDPLFVLCYVL